VLEGAVHQSLIAGGAAHVLSLPFVAVDGDRAVATDYGRVYQFDEHGTFGVWRVVVSRWELERTSDGWRVVQRINQLLNGAAKGRSLLSRLHDTSA
jgi:hypothetical protein